MESNKTAGIVAVVLAIAVAVGCIVWFANREDTTATNETSQSNMQPAEQQANRDIVVVASETESLSTLVTAVKAANLVETLQGAGPFTVFAPTNDAFAALPAGTLDTLLKPENQDQLKSILTYHVVPGTVLAGDLTDGQVITTVQGGTLTVKIADGMVYLVDATGNQVKVEKADVNADNGVVHVIGGVLLPQ
ncbi:MAG TPA: fasciclin domain-containing protein [Candidatus Saccharibacteria bacterium]|nr:fasciclin domain-containing protein [Candidatus Nomurabacteria bacterium]HPD98968.1 fasciclin domain-containing protein [Candidatus Saccharibacteria bacterium]